MSFKVKGNVKVQINQIGIPNNKLFLFYVFLSAHTDIFVCIIYTFYSSLPITDIIRTNRRKRYILNFQLYRQYFYYCDAVKVRSSKGTVLLNSNNINSWPYLFWAFDSFFYLSNKISTCVDLVKICLKAHTEIVP